MSTLENAVRLEIEALHDFFVEWFNGTTERDQLDGRFLSRLHPDILFIPPEGTVMTRDDLTAGFTRSYGTNKDFRIKIRDVEIRHELPDHVMAVYTEWQAGAKASAHPQNARVTSVLMTKKKPLQWLHIQETWLPDAVRAAGPYDF